jgi:cation diffusion facilitator family transporter
MSWGVEELGTAGGLGMHKKATCRQCRDTAALTDLLTALALAVFKNGLGILTNSMALQAHALHSLADFLTKGINLVSIRLSTQPPSPRFPYGYGKAQFLSANLIGVSLVLGSLVFLWHNLQHLSAGAVTPPLPAAMIGAVVSAVTAEVMHRYLSCVGRRNNSPAILAAAADNRGDALSSLAVLAGVALSLAGWRIADHLAAILVSLLVLRVGARVAWTSIHGLMDASLPVEVLAQAREIAAGESGVIGVDEIRGRRLGETWALDLRLQIPASLSASELHHLSTTLRQRLNDRLPHAAEVHIAFVPV